MKDADLTDDFLNIFLLLLIFNLFENLLKKS